MSTEPSSTRKSAIVTGAAQGLGRSIAIRLARDGFNIVVNDLPVNKPMLEEVVTEISNIHPLKGSAKGPFAHIVIGDVSDSAAVQNIVNETVSTFGSLDVVSDKFSPYPCAALTSTLRWSQMLDL